MEQKKTLFERIGGTRAIEELCMKSTELMKKDPILNAVPRSNDPQRVHDNSVAYLTMLFAGPSDYKGKSMSEAHKNLNLSDAHFNLFMHYTRQTLAQMNISQDLMDEVCMVLNQTRGGIVNQGSLYQRLGGETTISKFNDILMDKIMADPVLSVYYGKTDIKKVQALRQKFLMTLFGEKSDYNGKTMREAHAKHNLDDSHFDRFLQATKDAFMALNLKEDLLMEVLFAIGSLRSEVTNKPSLFEQMGGFDVLEKILPKFQDKLKANPTMSPYFTNVDPEKLKQSRKYFFASILGGPRAHIGKSLRESHAGHQIDDKAFNIFMKCLYESFIESGVKEELVLDAMEIIDLTRDKILNRKSILERLGGRETLLSIIKRFHENLRLDSILGPMYAKTDPQRLIKGYTDYMAYLFGGMMEHEGQPLRSIHMSMKLTDMHLDLFISILSQTLKTFNIDADTTKEIEMLLERRRNQLLQRQSLWSRLGGEQFMEKTLRKFEEKIMKDPALKAMHQNVDMEKYHQNHKDFFAQMFGGYSFYSGKSLMEAHGPLNLKNEHFDLFLKLFRESLTEMGTKEDMITEVNDMMELKRSQVLNKNSLYDRLGGEPAMEVLVEKLNQQLTTDPVLGPKHQGVDMAKLYLHRKQFFTQMFGNMNVYHGKDMRSVHSDLHLNDEHFNLFIKHFKSAMQELHIKEDLAKEVISHIETMRREILNQPSLFEKLGGKSSVEQFVQKLNNTMSKDPNMSSLLEKVDMNKYTQDQMNYFLCLFGGQSMAQQKKTQETFHEPLPLSDEHFKTFVEHTNEALKGMNVDKTVIDEIVKVFQVRRSEVIGQ